MVNNLETAVADESSAGQGIISKDEGDYLGFFSNTEYSASCYNCQNCKACIGGGVPPPK